MQGVIQAVEYSKKGAPKFKINNSWYYAGRCKVDGLHVGAEIEFESNLFGEQNNLNGLQWWKPVSGGARQNPGPESRSTGNAQQRPSNGPTGPSSAPADALYLPFISNTVAHAIQAGLIKTPADVASWVLGAKAAMSAKVVTTNGVSQARQPQVMADPEFDDDLDAAFYGQGKTTAEPEF